MGLGTDIRLARGARRREEFAAIIGCSLTTVIRWERDATVPTDYHHIERLKAEGVTIQKIRAAQGREVAA